jgi:hypothetical protein
MAHILLEGIDINETYLNSYLNAIEHSFLKYPPPFSFNWYGDRFRFWACDPVWLANSLINNSIIESEGSIKLWQFAGEIPDFELSDIVRLHAIDESAHARVYLKILELVFPDKIKPDLITDISSSLSRFTLSSTLERTKYVDQLYILDSIIQMNIGEIRTRINQLLMKPVLLAYCSEENLPQLNSLVNSLLTDETKHILYTAELINNAIKSCNADVVTSIFDKRLNEFNILTLQEIEQARFEGQ